MALLRQCLFELRAVQQAETGRRTRTAETLVAAAGDRGRPAEQARPTVPATHSTATGDFNGRATHCFS